MQPNINCPNFFGYSIMICLCAGPPGAYSGAGQPAGYPPPPPPTSSGYPVQQPQQIVLVQQPPPPQRQGPKTEDLLLLSALAGGGGCGYYNPGGALLAGALIASAYEQGTCVHVVELYYNRVFSIHNILGIGKKNILIM